MLENAEIFWVPGTIPINTRTSQMLRGRANSLKGFEGETHWASYSVPIKNKSDDIEIITKNGVRRNIEASVSLMKDSKGNAIGFREIFRDGQSVSGPNCINNQKLSHFALHQNVGISHTHSIPTKIPLDFFKKGNKVYYLIKLTYAWSVLIE